MIQMMVPIGLRHLSPHIPQINLRDGSHRPSTALASYTKKMMMPQRPDKKDARVGRSPAGLHKVRPHNPDCFQAPPLNPETQKRGLRSASPNIRSVHNLIWTDLAFNGRALILDPLLLFSEKRD